ncbi:hypothetical protein MBLNU230_g6758t1 [Neophaeotheca triangularis]
MLSTTLLSLAGTAAATNLFVSSYSGIVTSLSLTASNDTYRLNSTSESPECGPSPSWLTIDSNRGLLFCLNEGLTTPNGSLSSFTINADGSLDHVQNTTTISGPVSGQIYGAAAGRRAIALAHYSGSAVSSWLLDGGGRFTLNQNIPYTLDEPGPNADRQDAPHEHQAILDPTGQYILVPDLAADLVRVLAIDPQTLELTPTKPLQAPPGSGPRHGVFYNPYSVACESCTTFFYLVTELGSTVEGYHITYLPNRGGLAFENVYSSNTRGLFNTDRINAPAEIQISPDNRFLTISNRNDTSFSLPNPAPGNGTLIPSDSLSTFQLSKTGELSFVQLWPAGGRFPRHFSMNAVGDLVAVGLQNDGVVRILGRDVATGLIGEPVASLAIEGEVSAVVWDDGFGRLGGE